MTGLIDEADIEDAHRRLRDVVLHTPLLPARWLADEIGAETRLKCENLQLAGAFKLRGAYNMISRLDDDARRAGVVTYSSGNHAQAVAFAARLFHVPAVVVMPETAPAVKIEGARRLGAEIVLHGTTSTERQRRAEELAARRGLAVVPPFDHPHIIAGQGTVGLEILRDWPDVQAVLVPVGGGGLISGVAAWIRSRNPQCAIIGVEPRNADAMRQSLRAGRIVTVAARPTIADGLAPVRPGRLNFEHVRSLVDDVVAVDDDDILRAAAALLEHARLVVEFSGAATVAALLARAWAPRRRRTVAILSGGNLDPARALSLLQHPGADA